jgi:adenosine deaminase
MNILVCSVGTWQLVPEAWGFFCTNPFDLYANHNQLTDINRVRDENKVKAVDAIWCVTTGGDWAQDKIKELSDWATDVKVPIKTWQTKDVGDTISRKDCQTMAELIFRVVLQARKSARESSGKLYLSLAGGRKTMSTDIQRAGSIFGCDLLIHIAAEQLPKNGSPNFKEPLPKDYANVIMPISLGKQSRNQVIEIQIKGKRDITSEQFPIPIPEDGETKEVSFKDTKLLNAVTERLQQSNFFLTNFTLDLVSEDKQTSFYALFNLPSEKITCLKETRLGVDLSKKKEELNWLKQLPKAELHCHLGGIANAEELVRIAMANQEEIDRHKSEIPAMKKRLEKMSGHVKKEDLKAPEREVPVVKDIRSWFPDVNEPYMVAAFIALFEENHELLDQFIFGRYLNEKEYCGIDITEYEQLGDLQGSGLLQSEASLREACCILVEKVKEHNVRYLELRCSPINYTRGGLDKKQVVEIIVNELAKCDTDTCRFGLIFIGSRHGEKSEILQHIKLTQDLTKDGYNSQIPIVGFDLAGNEAAMEPEKLRPAFLGLMQKCIRLTIHAGETMDADSIWQAVYHLNADRIGHGLTLKNNQNLIKKFKARRIALEMCPSSNFQVVGFKDNYYSKSSGSEEYPLKSYLQQGLRVTVNTDNPGISRTDFTNELHKACRLTPGGLSKWELLQIIRAGFQSAFVSEDTRKDLLMSAERELTEILSKDELRP